MVYEFRPRSKDTGALITGLTPVFSRFFKISDGIPIVDVPAITETNGIYHFTYVATEDIDVEIDLGASANVALRYIDFVLSPLDEIVPVTLNQVESGLSGLQSGVSADIGSETTNIQNSLSDIQDLLIAEIRNTRLGDISVNHNYGSVDALRYVNSNGAGIDNAVVTIYMKSDYDAGSKGDDFVIGRTTTLTDGRWKRELKLDRDMVYIVEFYKQGYYNPSTVEITT